MQITSYQPNASALITRPADLKLNYHSWHEAL
jgi:hypothetical protein